MSTMLEPDLGLHRISGLSSLLVAMLALGCVAPSRAAAGPASADKAIEYLRLHYGIADTVKMTSSALRESASPAFYEAAITMDDGKPADKKTQNIYLSKDGKYLIAGTLYALSTAAANEDIIKDVREAYKLPATMSLLVAPPAKDLYPGFYSVKVSASNGHSQEFYLTEDQRTLVLGEIFRLSEHPEEDFRHTVEMADQPAIGPAHAPVTIVEYADLECPYCAQMHQFIEHDLVPKYGRKVRVVFKEFPLVTIHTWALTAAIADECAYQIDPKAFLPYRTLIFQHQNDIDTVASTASASTVREMLLNYAEQVGIDKAKLAACMDSKASQSRVDRGMREGKLLGITRTPTFFINRRIQSALTPENFDGTVDRALREAESGRVKRAEGRTVASAK